MPILVLLHLGTSCVYSKICINSHYAINIQFDCQMSLADSQERETEISQVLVVLVCPGQRNLIFNWHSCRSGLQRSTWSYSLEKFVEEILSDLFVEFFPHFSISIWKGPMNVSKKEEYYFYVYKEFKRCHFAEFATLLLPPGNIL